MKETQHHQSEKRGVNDGNSSCESKVAPEMEQCTVVVDEAKKRRRKKNGGKGKKGPNLHSIPRE